MFAVLLLAAVTSAAPATAELRPTVAVVITGHEGLSFDQAMELARRLTRALGAAGASAPMDPQAIVERLGAKNPEACGSRSPCLADLARALHVSALVTLEGGKVVDDIALVASLIDGRDGRKLLERSSSSAPGNLDASFASLASELARVASALPVVTVLDAPIRTPLVPRADPRPAFNVNAPTLATGGGALISGGVAVGFLAAALLEWRDLAAHTHQYTGSLPPGTPSPMVVDYPMAEVDASVARINQRLTISLAAAISSAVLSGAATYFLMQQPAK